MEHFQPPRQPQPHEPHWVAVDCVDEYCEEVDVSIPNGPRRHRLVGEQDWQFGPAPKDYRYLAAALPIKKP